MRSLEGLVVLTLKIVRVARGLTLTALETQSHVNATDISRIERGKLIPSASQLDKLSAALDISAEDLMKPADLHQFVTSAPQQAVVQ